MVRARPRIGILTSGGDSPGMNAAVEALTYGTLAQGWAPCGVRDGFVGLRSGRVTPLSPLDVVGINSRPGTVLGTSRPQGLEQPAEMAGLVAAVRAADLNALAVLGGDGSIGYIAALLDRLGVPCVAVPCTIDNDVPETEYSLGLDSACQFALAVVDGMRQTGQSLPGRVFLLETLGGNTGHLALQIAYAAQADAVAIPEAEPDWAAIGSRLSLAVERTGQALLVVSEGLTWRADPAAALAPHLAHRIRKTALGHAQRGGIPSTQDRVIGRALAEAAIGAVVGGRTGCMLAWRAGKPAEVPLAAVAAGKREPDWQLYASINER
ncbi:MAG: ATP-dependent 6-phosphofructokinase [Firmicutes bacterium]|nr:ATP-dependent 6-phosphofructokinase [Bacillota bacterium]